MKMLVIVWDGAEEKGNAHNAACRTMEAGPDKTHTKEGKGKLAWPKGVGKPGIAKTSETSGTSLAKL